MKKTFLLTAILLIFGCAVPLSSYHISTAALIFAQGESTQNGVATTSDATSTLFNESTLPYATASIENDESETDAQANADDVETELASSDVASLPTSADGAAQTLEPFLIQDESTGEVLTVSVRDYLIGAVACEMPMTWPDDALQAQAIAAHSYVLYCKEHSDTSALGGAYLTADPARRQGFMTDDVLRSYWGDSYDENYARLAALVDEILDFVVCYDGAPAATTYFAISNGQTETSEAVWGEALPYLSSVASSEDLAADGYTQSVTYTTQQVEDALLVSLGINTSGISPSDYFQSITYTDAGYVALMDVCGLPISGVILRSVFSLRSSCFSITYENECFTMTTYGYGHGVGLSQWGANFRAQRGESWQEILAYYFPNTYIANASAFEP